jgi:hypothetical protein
MGCPFLAFSGRLFQQPPALPIKFELEPRRDRQALADLMIFSEDHIAGRGGGISVPLSRISYRRE